MVTRRTKMAHPKTELLKTQLPLEPMQLLRIHTLQLPDIPERENNTTRPETMGKPPLITPTAHLTTPPFGKDLASQNGAPLNKTGNETCKNALLEKQTSAIPINIKQKRIKIDEGHYQEHLSHATTAEKIPKWDSGHPTSWNPTWQIYTAHLLITPLLPENQHIATTWHDIHNSPNNANNQTPTTAEQAHTHELVQTQQQAHTAVSTGKQPHPERQPSQKGNNHPAST